MEDKIGQSEGGMLDNKYVIIKSLGEGATSDVYLVQPKDESDKKNYAAKVLKKEDNCFLNEIEMLKLVKGQFITNLVASGEGELIRKGDSKGKRQYLVLEIAEKGNLCKYIHYPEKGLSEKHGKLIFTKILEGIQSCHKAGVCHRDLKSENILLDSEYNPKICDFGCATLIQGPDGSGFLKNEKGTPYYKCPEILRHKPYKGVEADIFSLGALLITIITGKFGFRQASKDDMLYNFIKDKNYDKYWEQIQKAYPDISVSQQFKNLYVNMISFKPNNRPSIEDILNKDEWLKEIRDLNEKDKEALEKEVKQDFIEREAIVNEKQKIEVQIDDIGEEEGGFRGIDDENKEYFSLDLKPKFLQTELNMENYIKIKGDVNPCKFMNRLANDIYSKNKDFCEIEQSNKSLKFKVNYKDNEKDKFYDDEEADPEFECDTKNSSCIIKINLLESFNGGYILKFSKLSGDINDYYQKLEKIYKLVSSMS